MYVCSTPGQACACRTSPARQPIYRSVDASIDHLYSQSQSEGPSAGYTDEGVVFYLYAAPCQWGMLPFYRVYNSATHEHFYTAAQSEYDGLVANGWWPEAPPGCIDLQSECGSTPLYRLLAAKHFFTTSAAERDTLVGQGWLFEGIAGYVWTTP